MLTPDPPGEVTTARELYDRDDTFRAGIAAWVEEKRCDLRLVDLLMEHGLTGPADAARWAATEPDRRLLEQADPAACGPFPSCYQGTFYWYDCESTLGEPRDCHDVPRRFFGRQVNYLTDKFSTAADALLFLLDNCRPDGSAPTKSRRRKRK
jgi:hypothetical protein